MTTSADAGVREDLGRGADEAVAEQRARDRGGCVQGDSVGQTCRDAAHVGRRASLLDDVPPPAVGNDGACEHARRGPRRPSRFVAARRRASASAGNDGAGDHARRGPRGPSRFVVRRRASASAVGNDDARRGGAMPPDDLAMRARSTETGDVDVPRRASVEPMCRVRRALRPGARAAQVVRRMLAMLAKDGLDAALDCSRAT